ncbi:MAG: hypothetical protein ACRCR1_04990 [Aeromonas sp.]
MRHLASLILLYPTLTLATLDARWVDAAKQRGEVVDLTGTLSSQAYQALRLGYLHYSADTGLVNTPNTVGDKEVRQITGNKKGGY